MTNKAFRYVGPALLILAGLMARPAAAQVVNTDPSWNGSNQVSSIGNPNSSTYAEVITAPVGTTSLSGLSFDLEVPVGFEFQVFVAPWDNTNLDLLGGVGGILYTTPTQTASDSALVPYIFNGLSIPLTAGDTYVLAVTVDNNYADDATLTGGMGGDIFNASKGNSTNYLVWGNESGDITQLASNWNDAAEGCADNTGTCGQAAYQVGFNGSSVTAPPAAAPEPSSMLLLGSGVLGLLGIARRRLS